MTVKNQTPQQARLTELHKSNRQRMLELYQKSPLPIGDMVVNFPLYTRSSAIAKMLYIQELYQLIAEVPGVVMEFGVWWGANLALFESYRAIYEPYNYTRKIIGFDTFEGYASLSTIDGDSGFVNEGNYSVPPNYSEHLAAVLDCHQAENVMANVKKYELIKGDATQSINEYLNAHKETIVALAYFDMQLYQPTKVCLEAIKPCLTKGSVIALDELNCPEYPGETIALREVFGTNNVRLIRSKILPDRTYFVID